MTLRIHPWFGALGLAWMVTTWVGAADPPSDPKPKRDPAQLLKRSPERIRNYKTSMSIDFGMLNAGQKDKKSEQIDGLDIPDDLGGDSFSDVGSGQINIDPLSVNPSRRKQNPRKKNWLLPPGSETDDELDPFSSSPLQMMMQVYEDDQDSFSRLLEGALDGGTYPGSDDTQDGSAGDFNSDSTFPSDDPESRYSNYDGGLREASENFLYNEADMGSVNAESDFSYSPVINDRALNEQGELSGGRNGSSLLASTKLENLDQLEQLSNEELAALANQRMEENLNDPSEYSEGDQLNSIQQFTQMNGLNGISDGLRQTRSILSGGIQPPEAEEMDDGSGDNEPSWRSSLSALSGVLNNMPAAADRSADRSVSPMNTSLPPGASPLPSPSTSSFPAAAQIRNQFSFGGNAPPTTYVPFGTSRTSTLGGAPVAAPTSMSIGSGILPDPRRWHRRPRWGPQRSPIRPRPARAESTCATSTS